LPSGGRRWIDTTDAALELISGAGGEAERRRDALARLAAARRDPYRVADDQIDGFVRSCLWLDAERRGLERSA